jgi:hypothetical protein
MWVRKSATLDVSPLHDADLSFGDWIRMGKTLSTLNSLEVVAVVSESGFSFVGD